MGKISVSDKMRIQSLHELGLGYRRIVSKFPVNIVSIYHNTADQFGLCLAVLATLKKNIFKNVVIN